MKISGILKFTAIAVSAAILFIACEKDDFVDDDSAIVSISAEGVPTTKLIFTVNDSNLVLTAEDIKINAKNFSVIKGKLTKKGTSYELAIKSGGTDKIRVGLDPYRGFTGWNAKVVNVCADWYFNGTENLTITGYNQSIIDLSETPIPIPAEIAEKPITAIGYRAFYNKELTSVSFSDGVQIKAIGASAFAENQLAEIIIPDSVKTIGDTSFAYNRLSKVVLPNEITDIGYGVFAYNQLTEVTIPNSVTSIGNYAFGSNQLTEVTIPNSVTSIGNYAFGYNNLKKIEILGSVTRLSGFNDNKLTAIKIPDTVTSIGSSAFAYNNLSEVTIPAGVRNIEIHAFIGNPLTKISIGENVMLDGYAFRNGFEAAYYNNEMKKGTYTFTGGVWNHAP